MLEYTFLILLLTNYSVYGNIIPSYYYMELSSNQEDIRYIIHQNDKSIVNINNMIYHLNICTPGNETIVKYNHTSCQITCIEGKDNQGNLCGSCSSYNSFYWLPLTKEIGKCSNYEGLLYKYIIDDGIYVEYCINNHTPIYIKIQRPNITLYKQVTKWKEGKYNIEIPVICNK